VRNFDIPGPGPMIWVIQDDGAIFIRQRQMGDVVPGAHDVVGWNALVTLDTLYRECLARNPRMMVFTSAAFSITTTWPESVMRWNSEPGMPRCRISP